MSDSNRLLFAAAAIGLIACALIWGVAGVGLLTRDPDRAEAHYQINSQRESNQYQSYRSAVALTEQACAEASASNADDPEQSDKRDLCAQFIAAAGARRSANYAQAQTWIGVIGFLFVIAGLVLNWIATLAASDQAKVSQKEFAFAHPASFKIVRLTIWGRPAQRLPQKGNVPAPPKMIPEEGIAGRMHLLYAGAHPCKVKSSDLRFEWQAKHLPMYAAFGRGKESEWQTVASRNTVFERHEEEICDRVTVVPRDYDPIRDALYVVGHITFETMAAGETITHACHFCRRYVPSEHRFEIVVGEEYDD